MIQLPFSCVAANLHVNVHLHIFIMNCLNYEATAYHNSTLEWLNNIFIECL